MSEQTETGAVVVRDHSGWKLGRCVDADTAMTLLAVVSEDPACWDEMASYWPRYRTPVVPEFLDSVAVEASEPDVVRQAVRASNDWLWIDFVEQRVVTGHRFQAIERDDAFAMVVDDDGRQRCPLSIHLPPWWELHSQVDAEVAERMREAECNRPVVNRDVLFGDALLNDLAERVLAIVRSDRWPAVDSNGEPDCYPLTIEVHREWLMTPRDDLDGLMPRQLLHGAQSWIDKLASGQRLRFEHGGELIAAPYDVSGFATAPMGLQEMVIYFDLCRELIAAAWFWCESDEARSRLKTDGDCLPELVGFLREAGGKWLESPFEGGSPPRFIIECSRRRVPRGANVPIVGMAEREPDEHLPGCDCPICDMIADGMFGVGFTSLDGHHLELDDEFAFSTCETLDEWEGQQRDWAEMSAEMERKRLEREAAGESEPDEFASPWTGFVSDGGITGDRYGHLKLAFLLAEIVSELQGKEATHSDIQELNERFAAFRSSGPGDLAASGKGLGECLEELADRYPDLVPRVADFQSRIDDHVRSPPGSDDLDVPF